MLSAQQQIVCTILNGMLTERLPHRRPGLHAGEPGENVCNVRVTGVTNAPKALINLKSKHVGWIWTQTWNRQR